MQLSSLVLYNDVSLPTCACKGVHMHAHAAHAAAAVIWGLTREGVVVAAVSPRPLFFTAACPLFFTAACPSRPTPRSRSRSRSQVRAIMASSLHWVEPWTWFCGGDLAPSVGTGSPCLSAALFSKPPAQPTTCLRQAIVSFTQMLLLFAFFLCVACFPSILPGALSRSELRKAFEIGSILYNVTAVLSGLVALAFLTTAIWVLVVGNELFPHMWLSLLVQGVAWLTIACSLRIRLRNPTKQVAYVWWILTFLVATLTMFLASLDLLTGATVLSVELFLVISSWPVSCLLLTCAINGERWIMVEVLDVLEAPLLTDARLAIDMPSDTTAMAS